MKFRCAVMVNGVIWCLLRIEMLHEMGKSKKTTLQEVSDCLLHLQIHSCHFINKLMITI